jgi:hypothetical protein
VSNLSTHDEAARLAAYIQGLGNFAFVERGEPYGHMGATITDAILQAGMRYDAQVLPRVRRLLKEHPEAGTSSGFLRILADRTPEVVVGINGRKAAWVQQLTSFLVGKEIETEDQLRAWLAVSAHEQQLFALKGVGLKTVNYLKILVGIPESVAVDTHIRSFLASAGIYLTDDREAGRIVAEAAELLGISPAQLDASIWAYRARSLSMER